MSVSHQVHDHPCSPVSLNAVEAHSVCLRNKPNTPPTPTPCKVKGVTPMWDRATPSRSRLAD